MRPATRFCSTSVEFAAIARMVDKLRAGDDNREHRAACEHDQSIKGSITPGKLADFVVLSGDPFSGPPELLLSTSVEATVAGGMLVHGDV